MRATEAGRPARLAGRAMAWIGGIVVIGGMASAWAADGPTKDTLEKGRELFLREWTPNDPRSHGGDGLGPVFNDSSCVSCHNAGGTGGGGPASKNVDILSAFANGAQQQQVMFIQQQPRNGFAEKAAEALFGIEPPKLPSRFTPPKPRKPDTGPLIKAHAGFRTTRSVVLHRFGVEPDYETWRNGMIGLGQFMNQNPFGTGFTAEQNASIKLQNAKMIAQFKTNGFNGQQGTAGEFSLLRSQRNPTALFGAGRMDAIPDSVLVATAEAQRKTDPSTAGRVARQRDGRIGRFGWKAQTPSLNDFVLTACAVELGLEVPGHGQGGLPQKPEAKAKGLDMDADECGALVAYVKSLAKPVEMTAHSPNVAAGRDVFAKVGCVSCHMPKLGDVDGIYSDLLVHDLGPELGDTGQYGVFTPGSADPEFQDDPTPPAGGGQPGEVARTEPEPVSDVTSDAIAIGAQAFPVSGFEPPAGLGLFARLAMRAVERSIVVDRTDSTVVTTEIETPAPPPDAPQVPQPVAAPGLAVPIGPGVQQIALPNQITPPAPTGPAGRQEWRTPPLWGFRDSGPYLHDGRADTLEQAVALHGGQGQGSAMKFFALSPKERMQLEAFLKSLAAPAEGAE